MFQNVNWVYHVHNVVHVFTLQKWMKMTMAIRSCKHCGKEHQNWLSDFCSFRCTADALDR